MTLTPTLPTALLLLASLSVGVGCESEAPAASDATADSSPDSSDTFVAPSALALACQQGSDAVAELHKSLGEIPAHLLDSYTKLPGDWDAANHFTVLTKLAMKQGYVLDWTYTSTGGPGGGRPSLYARTAAAPPHVTEHDFTSDSDWRGHVLVEDSSVGFLELALLDHLGEQFYRHWHDREGRRVLCTQAALSAALDNHAQYLAVPPETRAEALVLDVEPSVVLSATTVTVSYVGYAEASGDIVRWTLEVPRVFPHAPVASSSVSLLELGMPYVP